MLTKTCIDKTSDLFQDRSAYVVKASRDICGVGQLEMLSVVVGCITLEIGRVLRVVCQPVSFSCNTVSVVLSSTSNLTCLSI